MDLLLLNDRIGGRVKEGGIVFPRFVKPNRRLRGTEDEEQKDLSDTFLSSMGTRMLMNAPPSARTRPMNPRVTATSSDQNPLFLIQFPESNQEKQKRMEQSPIRSVRSLYNDRFQVELECCAGRAQLEHIGSGHNILMDCTPRALRAKKNQLRKHGLVKESSIAHPIPYPSLSQMPEPYPPLPQVPEGYVLNTNRQKKVSMKSSRSDQGTSSKTSLNNIISSSRSDKLSSARSTEGIKQKLSLSLSRLDNIDSSRSDQTSRTSRSGRMKTNRSTARSEKERIGDEMKILEKKLNKIEDMLEIRSARSTQSKRSVREEHSA